MNISLSEYERLQKYLDGEMTAGEASLFEEELKTNTALAEYFELEKGLQDVAWNKQVNEGFTALDENTRKDIEVDKEEKERILALLQDDEQPGNKNHGTGPAEVVDLRSKRSRLFWYKVAAVLVVLAAVTWFILSRTRNNSNNLPIVRDDTTSKKRVKPTLPGDSADKRQQLPPPKNDVDYIAIARQYYTKPTAPEDKSVPLYIREALKNYNEGNYDNLVARVNLDNIPASRGTDPEKEKQTIKELGHYYKGIALTEIKEHDKAIEQLQWVADSAVDATLKVNAQWHLSLIYLKQKNSAKAIALLKQVARPGDNNSYKANAQKILEQLKEE